MRLLGLQGVRSAVPKPLLLVSLAAFFYTLGNGAVWFVLPIKAEALLKNLMLVGLIVAVPNAVSLIFDASIGGYSDRVGRKKLFFVGLLVMVFLGLLLPSIYSLPAFILFMVVFGLANQLIFISGRAYLMDIAPAGKTSSYFGVQEAAAQIGFAIGPVVAGVIVADSLSIGIQNTGLLYAALCLVALFCVFLLKETVKTNESPLIAVKNLIEKDKILLRSILDFKQLKSAGLLILVTTFVITSADGLIWALEPLYANRGVDSAAVGVILFMFVLPYILFNVPLGHFADKHGKKKLIVLGLFLSGVFLILFGYSGSELTMIATAFIATTGLACIRPSLGGLLTDLAQNKQKGGVVGIWDAAEDLGYIIGPLTGGIIAEFYKDISIPFVFLGIIMLALGVVTLILPAIKSNTSVA
ncbi:Multidrug resistance protein MdtG [uncultured archaeon]|nr:Multidrug resistance protein MdtG [uncultured archaeon]